MKSSLLLIEILNQSPSSFLHLGKTAFKSEPVRNNSLVLLQYLLLLLLLLFWVSTILRMPHIVSDELLKGVSPMVSEILLSYIADCSHQSFDILYQDVIACDEYFLLRWWWWIIIRRSILLLSKVLHTLLVMSRYLRWRFGSWRRSIITVTLLNWNLSLTGSDWTSIGLSGTLRHLHRLSSRLHGVI